MTDKDIKANFVNWKVDAIKSTLERMCFKLKNAADEIEITAKDFSKDKRSLSRVLTTIINMNSNLGINTLMDNLIDLVEAENIDCNK